MFNFITLNLYATTVYLNWYWSRFVIHSNSRD